jgi:hypothetical protein
MRQYTLQIVTMPQEHDQAIDPNLARLAAAYEEADEPNPK